MRIAPDISQLPPQENYRQYDNRGLPYTGPYEYMRPEEYSSRTTIVARAGIGNFDTAKPDQQWSGRTLNEVLVKSAIGEYRIMFQHHQWVRCDKFGVRIVTYIQWVEFSDRPVSESTRHSTAHPVTSTFMRG